MAENGPHWPTIDFATLGIGAVLVPVYPTLTSEQAAYVVNDCGAEIVFVQGRERLDGLLEIRDEMPKVKRFVVIDGEPPSEDIKTLDRLIRDSDPMPIAELKERAAEDPAPTISRPSSTPAARPATPRA